MNTITIYQIVLSIIAVVIIVQRTIRFVRREKTQSLFKYLTFVIIWGGIAVVSIFPRVAHWIRRAFGFGENFNTLIFIAFVILFVLFFRMMSIIERIESQITDIVRKEALKGMKKKTSGGKSIKKFTR